MKSDLKAIAIILGVSLLGGCAAKSSVNSEGSQTASESVSSVTSAPASEASETPSVPISETEAPSTPAPTPPKNWEDFIGADGLPISFADATDYGFERIEFDFAPVVFPPAVYDDTFKNPALINWETMEFSEFGGEFKPTFTRLKKGDKLDNGLEVLEAVYAMAYSDTIDETTFEIKREWCESHGWVRFGGQITIPGTLYCEPRDDYQVFSGELYFFPDTTDFPQLPVRGDFFSSKRRPIESAYPEERFAARSGAMFYLGNVDDNDLEGIIERGKAAAVTVTLDEISLQFANIYYGGRGGGNYAKIVDIKLR